MNAVIKKPHENVEAEVEYEKDGEILTITRIISTNAPEYFQVGSQYDIDFYCIINGTDNYLVTKFK